MALQLLQIGDKVAIGYDTTTGEQGYLMKVQIAESVVKGNVLSCSSSVDFKYIKQTNEFDTTCVAQQSGSVNDYIWVWKHGSICQVLMTDGDSSTRGYLCIASPTDGRVTFIEFPSTNPAVGEHFKECGHCKESKTSGTDVLVLIDFHTL